MRTSLKRRIAWSFALVAFILAGFFTLVSYLSVEVIEEQVLNTRLEKLAGRLIEQHSRNLSVDTPPDVDFFVDDSIPEDLRHLSPGIHELRIAGEDVLALIRVEGGKRFAAVQEISEYEHTEHVIFAALAVGFVSSLILAVILGLATARHVIAPVTALADAVNRNADPATLPSIKANEEIGMLARAFAKRTEELQQVLMRERLFTGDVSHELRTPLTIMLGAAELLQAQLADRPAQLAVAERIRRVAAETSERVSAMLLLSRAPESLSAPRTELHALIQAELDRCRHLLIGKPVQCRVECTESVWIDVQPELAGIAIGNLLRNACQHAEAGTIMIRLTRDSLVIEDNGPGLPEAVRERLFERFVRGSDPSVEGTGLGLSIVKRVVEHIGWEIRHEIPSGSGSRFILSFPP